MQCVRCNSNNAKSKGGRCPTCLAKLKSKRHTAGSAERGAWLADGALRRQDGKNGTAHHKSSGRGSRKEIESKIERAEKKTGQKLSVDRKDNSQGYTNSNTRAVPKKLNRGRHNVDGKKLREWQSKLKKIDSKLELNDLFVLAKAKLLADADRPTMDANETGKGGGADVQPPEGLKSGLGLESQLADLHQEHHDRLSAIPRGTSTKHRSASISRLLNDHKQLDDVKFSKMTDRTDQGQLSWGLSESDDGKWIMKPGVDNGSTLDTLSSKKTEKLKELDRQYSEAHEKGWDEEIDRLGQEIFHTENDLLGINPASKNFPEGFTMHATTDEEGSSAHREHAFYNLSRLFGQQHRLPKTMYVSDINNLNADPTKSGNVPSKGLPQESYAYDDPMSEKEQQTAEFLKRMRPMDASVHEKLDGNTLSDFENETVDDAFGRYKKSTGNMSEHLVEHRTQLRRKMFDKMFKSGEAQKMAIMDFILGNNDRHAENTMVTPTQEGEESDFEHGGQGYNMKGIDHGNTLHDHHRESTGGHIPQWIFHHWNDDTASDVSDHIRDWLMNVPADKLVANAKTQGLPERAVEAIKTRHEYAQQLLQNTDVKDTLQKMFTNWEYSQNLPEPLDKPDMSHEDYERDVMPKRFKKK